MLSSIDVINSGLKNNYKPLKGHKTKENRGRNDPYFIRNHTIVDEICQTYILVVKKGKFWRANHTYILAQDINPNKESNYASAIVETSVPDDSNIV